MTSGRLPVGPDNAPPTDTAAIVGHHPADLSRSALADVFSEVAIGGNLASRDQFDRTQHQLDVVLMQPHLQKHRRPERSWLTDRLALMQVQTEL